MVVCFSYISQDTVATQLRCGGLFGKSFENLFTKNLLTNVTVKEFCKLVKI